MATFPLPIVRYFLTSIGLKPLMRWTNCKIHKNPTKNLNYRVKKKCKFFTLMAAFPRLMVIFFFFFFKLNMAEAIDEMDKVCKFHENPPTNVGFIT